MSIVTVFEALASAGPGPAAEAAWLAISAAARAIQARTAMVLLISPVYDPEATKVQSREEKSTAATAVARLRLDTPSRIGIDRRASACSSSPSLSP